MPWHEIRPNEISRLLFCFQIPGGPADVDGRLQRGDILHSIDGKDLSAADHETAAAAAKSVGAKAVIKVKRFKIVR